MQNLKKKIQKYSFQGQYLCLHLYAVNLDVNNVYKFHQIRKTPLNLFSFRHTTFRIIQTFIHQQNSGNFLEHIKIIKRNVFCQHIFHFV